MKQFIFHCCDDLADIHDSMEVESGTTLATLHCGDLSAKIEVVGEVRVIFDDTIYKSPARFPEELARAFRDGTAYNDPRIAVANNNWFEVFVYDCGRPSPSVWTGYSDVVDFDGPLTAAAVFETLLAAVEDYRKERRQRR